MKYEVEENFTFSAYYAKIICDEDIYSQLNVNTCAILYDTITGNIYEYNYEELMTLFGLTKTDNEDATKWFDESFVNNNGVCFDVNKNIINVKLLTHCYDTTSSDTIGYNPSKLDIYINGVEDEPITLNVRFQPLIYRSLPYNLNEEKDSTIYNEPNESINIRRDFDYNRVQQIQEIEKIPVSNFTYDTSNSIYVNNRIHDEQGTSLTKTPLYVSDVSAFSATWATHGTAECTGIKSCIFNTFDSSEKEIEYEEIKSGSAKLNPFGKYETVLYYGSFRQYLNQPENEHAQGEMIFEVAVQNKEVEPEPPPEPTVNLYIRPNTDNIYMVQCSLNYDKEKWGVNTWDWNPNDLSESRCYYYKENNTAEINMLDAGRIDSDHNHILTRTFKSDDTYSDEIGKIKVTIWNPFKQGLLDFEKDGVSYKVFHQYKNIDTGDIVYLESISDEDGYEKLEDVWCWEHPRNEAEIDVVINNLVINGNASIDQSSIDSIKYISDGYLDFTLDNIKFNETGDDISLNIEFNLGYNETWDTIITDVHRWTMNNLPFIPKDFEEFFDKFVMYSESFITLNKSYLGPKSLYCTGLNVQQGSQIDCELYITGIGEKYQENNYNIIMQKLNNPDGAPLDRWEQDPPLPKTSYYDSNLPNIESFEGVNIDTDGQGLKKNPSCKTVLHLNKNVRYTYKIQQQNGSAVQDILYEDMDLKTLPTMTLNFEGGEDHYLNPWNDYYFDAKGGIQHFGKCTGGDGCKLHFKQGEYYFDGDFSFGTQCQIIIEPIDQNVKGVKHVKIFAKNIKLSTGFTVDNLNGDDNLDFWLCSDSNIEAQATTWDQKNCGIMYAKNKVDLLNNFHWQGAIWCKELYLGDNSVFRSVDL